jgi:hypothetical protein
MNVTVLVRFLIVLLDSIIAWKTERKESYWLVNVTSHEVRHS